MIKTLRQVFKLVVDFEYVRTNPTRNIDYLSSESPEGFHAWTMDEVEALGKKHKVGTKARLALAAMLYYAELGVAASAQNPFSTMPG